MRARKIGSIVGALALFLSAAMAQAQTSAYDSWSKLKPGSSVTLKTTTETAGQKSETEMTYVLGEVTPEKVVLEIKISMVVAGNKMDLPARKMDVAKGAGGTTPAPAPNPAPAAGITQSDETLTIAGKPYKCHVIEVASDANGMKVKSKTWTCPDVPNLLAKVEATTAGAVASKTSMEVTKIELK